MTGIPEGWGRLLTRSELRALFRPIVEAHGGPVALYCMDALFAAGYAREDPKEEPMGSDGFVRHGEPYLTPADIAQGTDPDSAVDALTKLIHDLRWRQWGHHSDETIARAVIAHLREHPELLGIPVMTASEKGKEPQMIDVKSMSYEEPVVELAYAMGQQIDDTLGRSWSETYARLAIEHLRDHPEFLGIPVMTASEARMCPWIGSPDDVPRLVIPDDPEPPVGLIDLIIPIVQQLDGLQCEVSEVKKQVLGLIETWKGGTNE